MGFHRGVLNFGFGYSGFMDFLLWFGILIIAQNVSITSCPLELFAVQQNLADLNASGYMKEFE